MGVIIDLINVMSHLLYFKPGVHLAHIWFLEIPFSCEVCLCLCTSVCMCVGPRGYKIYSCEMKTNEINSIVVQYIVVNNNY